MNRYLNLINNEIPIVVTKHGTFEWVYFPPSVDGVERETWLYSDPQREFKVWYNPGDGWGGIIKINGRFQYRRDPSLDESWQMKDDLETYYWENLHGASIAALTRSGV